LPSIVMADEASTVGMNLVDGVELQNTKREGETKALLSGGNDLFETDGTHQKVPDEKKVRGQLNCEPGEPSQPKDMEDVEKTDVTVTENVNEEEGPFASSGPENCNGPAEPDSSEVVVSANETGENPGEEVGAAAEFDTEEDGSKLHDVTEEQPEQGDLDNDAMKEESHERFELAQNNTEEAPLQIECANEQNKTEEEKKQVDSEDNNGTEERQEGSEQSDETVEEEKRTIDNDMEEVQTKGDFTEDSERGNDTEEMTEEKDESQIDNATKEKPQQAETMSPNSAERQCKTEELQEPKEEFPGNVEVEVKVEDGASGVEKEEEELEHDEKPPCDFVATEEVATVFVNCDEDLGDEDDGIDFLGSVSVNASTSGGVGGPAIVGVVGNTTIHRGGSSSRAQFPPPPRLLLPAPASPPPVAVPNLLTCPFCNFGCFLEVVMEWHARCVHLKTHKHSCRICGIPRNSSSSLVYHLSREHKIDDRHNQAPVSMYAELPDGSGFSCCFCGDDHKIAFDLEAKVIDHIHLEHFNSERVNSHHKYCEYCGNTFTSKTLYNSHMETRHSEFFDGWGTPPAGDHRTPAPLADIPLMPRTKPPPLRSRPGLTIEPVIPRIIANHPRSGGAGAASSLIDEGMVEFLDSSGGVSQEPDDIVDDTGNGSDIYYDQNAYDDDMEMVPIVNGGEADDDDDDPGQFGVLPDPADLEGDNLLSAETDDSHLDSFIVPPDDVFDEEGEGEGADYEENTDTTDVQRCDICRQEVVVLSKKSIEEHLKFGHGQDPCYRPSADGNFICLYCDYQTKYKQNVLHHTKCQHLKLKDKVNWKCRRCPYVCTYKSQITNHVKSVHKRVKDWQCSQCNYAASTKPSLKLHIRNRHVGGKADFSCELCSEDFQTNLKHELKKHIEAVHRGEGHQIRICNVPKCRFACATVERFASHMSAVHRKKNWDAEGCLGNVNINKSKYQPLKRLVNSSYDSGGSWDSFVGSFGSGGSRGGGGSFGSSGGGGSGGRPGPKSKKQRRKQSFSRAAYNAAMDDDDEIDEPEIVMID